MKEHAQFSGLESRIYNLVNVAKETEYMEIKMRRKMDGKYHDHKGKILTGSALNHQSEIHNYVVQVYNSGFDYNKRSHFVYSDEYLYLPVYLLL